MKEQNFKNHARLVPLFHIGLFVLELFVFIGSIVYAVRLFRAGENWLMPTMWLVLGTSLLIQLWYSRAFATTVQDRAIRAEENLRHFAMTGKLFDTKLTMDQIVALRFAPDHEFLELTQAAVSENLTNRQIKERIKTWRADHYRA